MAELLGGRVLGLGYDLAKDWLDLSIPVQYCRKGPQRQKELVHLGRKELEEIKEGSRSFSRREALNLVMGVFDPLGLVSPALLQGKLLLCRLYGPENLQWDTDLPASEKESWVRWLEELIQETEVHMERAVRPAGAVGGPVIAGFSDASISAMCATIYVVWQMKEGPPVSRLLLAKIPVTPSSGFSSRAPGGGDPDKTTDGDPPGSSLQGQQSSAGNRLSLLRGRHEESRGIHERLLCQSSIRGETHIAGS